MIYNPLAWPFVAWVMFAIVSASGGLCIWLGLNAKDKVSIYAINIIGCIILLIGYVGIGYGVAAGAERDARQEAYRNLPTVQELHPNNIDFYNHEVTATVGECQVIFTIGDDGKITNNRVSNARLVGANELACGDNPK
jgi:hypothetical protein